MTASITPRPDLAPKVHYQPSIMSLRSAANTVAPEEHAPNRAQQAPVRAARRKLWFFAALSTLLGVGAASLLNKPGKPGSIQSEVRSGSPGYRATSTGKDLHWEKKGVTIYLDDSLKRLGQGADEAVMLAFGQWVGSDARLPALTFDSGKTSTAPKQDGKSTVSFGPITAPGHEHDVAITVTYSNDKTGEIIEADVILNALYPMGLLTAKTPGTSANGDGKDDGKDDDKTGSSKSRLGNTESSDCRNRYDAQNVVTHEAGHFFGLGEDMTERPATMFFSIDQCETHKRVLALSDTTAMSTLYAQTEDPEEAKAGARGCSFGGVPPTGDAFWVSAAIFGASLLRRRRAR